MSSPATAPKTVLPDPTESGTAGCDGIEIVYEGFGEVTDPPIVMVMGLGMQLLGWDARFCELLAGRGYRVIRFDNRDAGLSSRFEPEKRANFYASLAGLGGPPPYVLADMAADVTGLLDHLELDRAHIVGASLGGMIGQVLTLEHPDRVLSLCSIMSTPGGRRRLDELPTPKALKTLLSRPPRDPEAFADHMAGVLATIGSPAYPADPEWLRERTLTSYSRAYNPAGTARQLLAASNAPDRRGELRKISCPVAVIHGNADPLIPAAAGKATAAAIPGSKLYLFDGMGHDLPPVLWPRFAEIITENAERA